MIQSHLISWTLASLSSGSFMQCFDEIPSPSNPFGPLVTTSLGVGVAGVVLELGG